MMLQINITLPIICTKQPMRAHLSPSCQAMCVMTKAAGKLTDQPPKTMTNEQTPIRRSANYKPSPWNFNHIQSLNNPYAEEIYVKRSNKLKEIVGEMLLEEDQKEPLDLLELIDDLQRLGLSYHFESQIKQVLATIYNKYNSILQLKEHNLYAKALIFRLLRQHGFDVSQEIFDCFKDDKGNFKRRLCEDTKGLLYLYEASYLSIDGETTMDTARQFTTRHLRKSLDEKELDYSLAALVHHALELPLHWRMRRVEARWFIDICEKRANMNPHLLELAKLDFNIVQAIYQEDLKYITRWWKNTGVMEKLPYTRDCIVLCLFWYIGALDEPQYGYARRMSAKIVALISIIDDTYDIYGTMDELQLFTDVIERWDIQAMDQLPYYMKVCFLLLYNYVNEMAYDALRDHGINSIPYLKKMWVDQCKAYLQEAKWYSTGYKPTLEEYKSTAMVSVGVVVSLLHTYLQAENPIRREALEAICNYDDIVHCSAMILRFADDLGTSLEEMERGDVPKLIQCYTTETSASEEEARKYVRFLISETWKEMNKLNGVTKSTFSRTYLKLAMDLDRAAHCIYEFGDGQGNLNSKAQDQISSILFKPIPVEIM